MYDLAHDPLHAHSPGSPHLLHVASPSFASFWIAGFEGADHRNRSGVLLDLADATGHAKQYRGDYRRARTLGISTVRESIGWRIAERGRDFDLSRAIALAREAQRQRVEIVWSLLHYGFPNDVDPFAADVVDRFVRFASATARALRPWVAADAWFNPVNEISFTCWLLTEGETGAPWRGAEAARARKLKETLVRCALRAAVAIRDVLPEARFLHIDPVIHAVPQDDDPALAAEAAGQVRAQWEAWDLVCDDGFEPSIARRDRVHLIGINHYHSSQWVVPSRKPLRWHLRDARRRPLADLCTDVHSRYRLPFAIAETSHIGVGRADWFRDVERAIGTLRERDLPLHGACLYPFVDRPDWERAGHWHRSGIWDVVPRAHANGPRRVPNRPYAAAFIDARRQTTARSASLARGESAMDALIVFSHLRWDSVWQRPQQLCTRFAERFRVLFVEEPLFEEGVPRAELSNVAQGVTVLRPHTALHAPGFHDDQLPALRPLLRQALEELRIERYAVYTFTPMALPLMQDLSPCAIAYDCMDELSAFKFAPRQLPQRESALLKVANVVFTGGPSLYRAKLSQHDNVHCFPSSVDAPHFATARRGAHVHPDVAALPRPRLGFYGVIDERLDLDLVAALAKARPRWQFVYVGPVVKIDPGALPRAANIHWMPQQPYAALPALIAGWDVCLLPFARNQHTRLISPTKTLEYLAADKPVVSTPIVDVVELYGSVVHFGDDPDSVVAACERLLGETHDEREARIAATRSIVLRTSWDATADGMADVLENAARSGLREEATALLAGAPASRRNAARASDAECVILGAGPTGLSAAYHYGAGATLLERRATVGGGCRSIVDRGFTFDRGGHIMCGNDAAIHELYRLLLGDNVVWQEREAWIYSNGVYTRHPFQSSLHGLPHDVVKECLLGAIEARSAAVPGSQRVRSSDGCGDGAGMAAVAEGRASAPSPAPANFEEFIHATWGRGIARHFAVPYYRKLWTYPLTEVETSWLGGRVPLSDLEQMVEGALRPAPRPSGPDARFGYPREGGFQALMQGFVPHLQGPLELGAVVVEVTPSKRLVALADGRAFRYDVLVSTLPLPDLVEACGDEAPADVRAAARRLRRVSVRCVNFGIGRESISDKHWIDYPEESVSFHRVFLQGNASARNNAPGGFALSCEISYSEMKPLPAQGGALIERCRSDLVRVGLLRSDDAVVTAHEIDIPCAYVLYDHPRAAAVARIREWLLRQNVLVAGRYGEWADHDSHDALIAGREAARSAEALVGKGKDARTA